MLEHLNRVIARHRIQFPALAQLGFILYLAVFFLLIVGCASNGNLRSTTQIEPGSIKSIGFRVVEPESNKISKTDGPNLRAVSSEISERFSNSGYPVTVMGDADYHSDTGMVGSSSASSAYSHLLEASVILVKQDVTPSGFSFGIGNSDPRSRRFQKTNVAEVTCTLRDSAKPEGAVTLVERKAAESITEIGKNPDEGSRKVYVETIGSTCHNLLTKLNIYPRASGNQSEKSLLSPIRTEHNYGTPDRSGEKNNRSEPKSADGQVGQPSESTVVDEHNLRTRADPPQQTIPPSPADSISKKTTTSESAQAGQGALISDLTKSAGSWRDERITIFNQGDPVILKFGYERR